MTRRERMEAKVEKREAWAEGRDSKAAALVKRNEPFRGDHAFNTQPGHIPERARAIKRSEKAFEHTNMANHHRSKADGLQRALDKSIYSDDDNAVEALVERIAAREKKAARMVALNRAIRKEIKKGGTWIERLDATDEEKRTILLNGEHSWDHKFTFPSYELSNLRGRIASDRKRIAQVKRQQEKTAQAEEVGGVLIAGSGDYLTVTFAEAPAKLHRIMLKQAGFYYSGGSWHGRADKLPEGIEPSGAA